MTSITITQPTDPGCPFAWSAEPARWRLQWLYGDQLEWRLRMVDLTERPEDYIDKGFTPERQSSSFARLGDAYGMPMDTSVGITWHETNAMARAAHAVVDGETVWLIDPFEDPAALEAAAALGQPAGVIQLLDRHQRDGETIANRLGVPLMRLPKALPGTPFEVVSVVARPWWREIALWWPAQRTLIVAEAIGTGPLFGLGRRAGVHPMLRRPAPVLIGALRRCPRSSAAVRPASSGRSSR